MSDIEPLGGAPRIGESQGQEQKDTVARLKPRPKRDGRPTEKEPVEEAEKVEHQIDDLG